MLKQIPLFALAFAVPLSALVLHAPQDTQPRPAASPTAEPHDHAINTKGTGGVNGRAASPAPSPTPLDHAINTKGTGASNGRAASPTPPPAPNDHAINTKGTGATSNGRAPQP